MIVAPSLLACDFLCLGEEVKAFDKAEDLWFHLDVMDGHYVENLTFGHTVLKNLKNITKHSLDMHLMVSNPDFYIKEYDDLGLYNMTFHWEACIHHDQLINLAKKKYASVGISLNPATPLSVIPNYILAKIDLLLIMSVNPGFGGQSFIENSYDKIKQAKSIKEAKGYQFKIQVDGGVTDKNAQKLRLAGADILVAGSYIFNAEKEDYLERVISLKS